MTRRVFMCGVLAALALIAIPAPAAAGTPVTVRLPICLGNGGPGTGSGQRTVPAGSQVTIASAWGSIARGTVMHLVDATVVTGAIDGVAIPDANSYFGPIERITFAAGNSGWRAEWSYDTGITLENPGDQMVVYYSWVVTRRVHVPQENVVEPGEVFDSNYCTITAK